MEIINSWIEQAAGFVWGWPLIVLLFGTHLFLTLRTGFVQRHLLRGIKLSVTGGKSRSAGDVSRFAALMTGMAASLGTGNIYGVAGAILIGGPGAVFWMWMTGVFGMATKYGEALLAVKYRTVNARGEMSGGAMYVLEHALKARWAGIIFAIFTAIAAFGIGNMVQSDAISEMIVAMKNKHTISLPISDLGLRICVGVVLAVLTGAVVLGGIKAIAKFCRVVIPFMALAYILGCVTILALSWETILPTIELIVTSAFTGHAAAGGFVGAGIAAMMRYGIARGLFSNEAGMGSSPIVDAAAKTNDPVQQALVSSTAVFWDTVVVCALTGLVLVGSGEWQQADMNKAGLCSAAFHHLGIFGDGILTFGLLTFVFSTLIGWGYYGEKAIEYLVGVRAVKSYRWLWVVLVFVGAVWKSDAVWNFSDIMNGLMAIPNVIALLLLSGVVAAETKRYFATNK